MSYIFLKKDGNSLADLKETTSNWKQNLKKEWLLSHFQIEFQLTSDSTIKSSMYECCERFF